MRQGQCLVDGPRRLHLCILLRLWVAMIEEQRLLDRPARQRVELDVGDDSTEWGAKASDEGGALRDDGGREQ